MPSLLTFLSVFRFIFPPLYSIDGSQQPPVRIKDRWIPFRVSSPIILHADLARAAAWRAEQRATALSGSSPRQRHIIGKQDSLEILALQNKSISLLNSRLRSSNGLSVDDEAIGSVAGFLLYEVSGLIPGLKSPASSINLGRYESGAGVIVNGHSR